MASSPFTSNHAGEAFLVSPPGQTEGEGTQGPGVLVLHSWWGLNDWTRDFARRVAAQGYTVLVPDLLEGAQPASEAEAEAVLAELDANKLSGLVMSSAQTIRAASVDASKPIAVIGLSMGASLALWISTKLPGSVGSVVSFYGAQSIDFDDATAKFQGHYAGQDHMVNEDDRVSTHSFIRMGENEADFHLYEEAKHWFFEDGENFDAAAAELAWERLVPFLASTIGLGSSTS